MKRSLFRIVTITFALFNFSTLTFAADKMGPTPSMYIEANELKDELLDINTATEHQ